MPKIVGVRFRLPQPTPAAPQSITLPEYLPEAMEQIRVNAVIRRRTQVHKYTVELRVEGTTLIPSEITNELGLKPSQTRLVGESRGKSTFTTALWAYAGQPSTTHGEWDSLEAGLIHVLDRLNGLQERLNRYQNTFKIYWWCGHFSSSFGGGPTLSPKVMQMLGEFGAPLMIESYFSEENDEAAS